MRVVPRGMYDRSVDSGVLFLDPSLCQQHLANETNINVIVAKFIKTGLLPQFAPGTYGDASAIGSLHTALNLVKQGEIDFMTLSGEVRRRFDDDPVKFMEFVNDPNSVDEGIKLGIFSKTSAVPKAEVKPPVAAPSSEVVSGLRKKVTTTVVEDL